MRSRWNEELAGTCKGYLEECVYGSRLLGQEASLVMHGGGNTSVKGAITNIFGETEEVLFVKGSGSDLATIKESDFTPCRMNHLLRLAELEHLTDTAMAAELRMSQTDITAPAASVEAILHALVPARFVDHTHADAILAITNTPDGERRVRTLFGDHLVYVPYVMPGFKLAKSCAQLFPALANQHTVGMLLLNHGLFTFGETAKAAYERMIDLVSRAERYLIESGADWKAGRDRAPDSSELSAPRPDCNELASAPLPLAKFRRAISDAAGRSMIVATRNDEEIAAFVARADLEAVALQGPATPDHVIRTKRVPLLGRDIDAFVAGYCDYFREFGNATLKMLDPAPRIVLDREWGLCAIGRTARDSGIVEDIYRHTMRIITAADALGGWRALPARDIFDVEYWELEQAKLAKSGSAQPFEGEVALVTGAASGIGKAAVDALLDRGAAVVGLDISPAVASMRTARAYLGIECDLRSDDCIRDALARAVRQFGGIDLLILNAGIFPRSSSVAALKTEVWRDVLTINAEANLNLMRECHPYLKLAKRGGRVVVIGSKNVHAPGPGAGAYSAAKAALQQLARVAALEWGRDGIRVNTLHPNAVFDTGIWTQQILEERARAYGMSVEQYKRNNVLGVEVRSVDVAMLVVDLCSDAYSKTTGAQIPVDGGMERVI